MSERRNPRTQITFKEPAQGIEMIRRGLGMIPFYEQAEALRHVLSRDRALAERLVKVLTTSDVAI